MWPFFLANALLTCVSDQEPVDQPPIGSDVDSEFDSEDEDAYNLDEVSSDVEVEVDVDEADLEDDAGYVSIN